MGQNEESEMGDAARETGVFWKLKTKAESLRGREGGERLLYQQVERAEGKTVGKDPKWKKKRFVGVKQSTLFNVSMWKIYRVYADVFFIRKYFMDEWEVVQWNPVAKLRIQVGSEHFKVPDA